MKKSNYSGRIRMSAAVAHRLHSHHLAVGKNTESCSYVLGHAHRDEHGDLTIVLADPEAVLLFSDDCFVTRQPGFVMLDQQVKAQVFLRAVQEGYSAVVDVHDHHFTDVAWFSGTDDKDDKATACWVNDIVRTFVPSGHSLFAAAMLISRGTWAARWVPDSRTGCFANLRVDFVGERFEPLSELPHKSDDPTLARHDGLITPLQRAAMQQARIAIVGAGGTGSIAFEDVLRLGFGDVTLIDADRVEASNLNRLQGVSANDVGRLKVEALAEHARRIRPDASIQTMAVSVDHPDVQAALKQADVILGCVDNGETRWWLNRFCVQYMIPWFDCGVDLHVGPPVLQEIRTSAILPGATACGHCCKVAFNPRRRPDGFLDSETLAAQRKAGYLADEPEGASPSAYPLNQFAVSAMIRELLNWYCGWFPIGVSSYWNSTRMTIDRLDPTVTGIVPMPECPVCGHLLGGCDSFDLPVRAAKVDLIDVARMLADSEVAK
ncbi:MAG: ThiF family adenylyltransferase [Aquimonas sp.]|nr:ThiF family adenylyltransferase [Aquimonas sp.]